MRPLVIALVGLLAAPAVTRADRIHLENGKTFDDVVVVSQSQSHVRFRLGSGEMSLPASWIERVERAPGVLSEYLVRQERLAAAPAPSAEGYLALARWARARDLDHGFRESLMLAAELKPELEGLAPLMAAAGYSFDSERGIWRRGNPAPAGGEPRRAPRPREYEEPARLAEPARSFEPAAGEIAAGLTRAIETLAEAELERSRTARVSRAARPVRTVFPFVAAPVAYASGGWFFSGPPLRPAGSDPKNPVIRKPANPSARALLARPPGSLLPLSAYRY